MKFHKIVEHEIHKAFQLINKRLEYQLITGCESYWIFDKNENIILILTY